MDFHEYERNATQEILHDLEVRERVELRESPGRSHSFHQQVTEVARPFALSSDSHDQVCDLLKQVLSSFMSWTYFPKSNIEKKEN